MKMNKNDRVSRVNRLIRVIAGCGRQFFRHGESVSHIVIGDNGRLYFVDEYSGEALACWREKVNWRWNSYKWRRFGGGGTIMELVKSFAMYIFHGDIVPEHHFGPWPSWYGDGDPWGYGDDMDIIRQAYCNMCNDADASRW